MIEFIVLHTLDGRTVYVNQAAIVSVVGKTKDGRNRQLSPDVTCVVTLSDGKFITVVEDCADIKKRIDAK